jgi:hypothetical protein
MSSPKRSLHPVAQAGKAIVAKGAGATAAGSLSRSFANCHPCHLFGTPNRGSSEMRLACGGHGRRA